MILLILLIIILAFVLLDQAGDDWRDKEENYEPFPVKRGPWWYELHLISWIVYGFFRDLKYIPGKILFGLKWEYRILRLRIRWFLRTYDTYDWDYSFLLMMIEQKMSDMIPHIEDSYLLNAGRYSTTLKYAHYHLKMYLTYQDEENAPITKLFHQKYGEDWYNTEGDMEYQDYLFRLNVRCKTKEYWLSQQHYRKFLRGMKYVEMWRD
jgi:hypothetical protein